MNSCDVAETCNGSETCPANGFASSTTVCGIDVTYTGPPTNTTNCGGVNNCGPMFILNCFDNLLCNGSAATCTRCDCFCDPL